MTRSTTAAVILMGNASQENNEALPEAYWELVSRYREKLLKQALLILGRQEDAEDVVQETFMEVFRNAEKLNQVRSVGAWLSAVNRGNALNRLASRRREARPVDTGRRAFTTGGFSVLELRDSITKSVQELPAKHREVVQLRFFEHLPFDEIAKRMNTPEGTVKWLACDAMVRLHAQLRKFFPGQASEASQEPAGPGGQA